MSSTAVEAGVSPARTVAASLCDAHLAKTVAAVAAATARTVARLVSLPSAAGEEFRSWRRLGPFRFPQWSDWDDRYGRQSREGSRSSAAGAAEIQSVTSNLKHPFVPAFLGLKAWPLLSLAAVAGIRCS